MPEPIRDDVRELISATGGRNSSSAPPLVQLIALLRRNLLIILLAAVLGLVAGWIWGTTTPLTYTAHATTRTSAVAPGGDPRTQAGLVTFVPFFRTRTAIAQAIKEVGGPALELTVNDVQRHLSVTPMQQTNTIEISFTWIDPKLAADLTNRIAAIGSVAASQLSGRDVEELGRRLEQSMLEEEKNFRLASDRALARRRAIQLDRLGAESAAIGVENSRLLTIDVDINETRATLAAIKAARVAAGTGEGASRIDEQIAAVTGKLAGLEARRADLLNRLGIPKLQVQKLSAFYQAQAEMARLDLDVTITNQSFQAAAARHRAFLADASVNRPVFAVIDEAVFPILPNSRGRMLKLLVALAGALAAAAVIVGLREGLRG
jgi:uncharacterized protein involved in exopolysaccharide biosynthesis